MVSETFLLLGAAASVGVLHTLLGPDHYLPFIAMSRARSWTSRKTASLTALCGLGHITASLILAAIGIALGVSLSAIEALDSIRGTVAAWSLIVFGLVYAIWGLRKASRAQVHSHPHCHEDGTIHRHPHDHVGGHLHVHDSRQKPGLTPWALFVIFLLGPCEALIPLLILSAATHNWLGLMLAVLVFSTVTVITMTLCVLLGHEGLRRFRMPMLARFGHALAGVCVMLCGLGVGVLGL